jgi:uncharacterized protein (DUF2236 family)
VTSPYAAAAAGIVERSAAAFVRAVPGDPADDGYFGPASVTWRVAGDLSAPVAGLRALLIQALHPLAMAGVDQHSDWRQDPVGRLAATSAYLATLAYGDRDRADRAAQQVRRVHEHVRGTFEGQPYAARDIRDGVIATLPPWALSLYEIPAPPPLTPERRTEIRGALGLLDAVFLGEPGVLEARQRIALRMRG